MTSSTSESDSDSAGIIFLSYNSRDKAAVERLDHELLERGIRTWRDERDLPPGKPWQREIEATLDLARVVLVCVGSSGIGDVQEIELRVAISHSSHDPERLVIPVLLPGAGRKPELPPFLREYTWVDLRAGFSGPHFDRLVAVLKGHDADPYKPSEVNLDALRTKRSFPTSLIGRQAEQDQLVRLLGEAGKGNGGLALIAGEAGIGKSRLAWELVCQAEERDFRVLVGQCRENEEAPLRPWIDILEHLASVEHHETLREVLGAAGPEVAKLSPVLQWLRTDTPMYLPPEEGRHYLLFCLLEFIRRFSGAKPLLVLLEDLHWADQISLLFLQKLASNIINLPILLIGTYRDSEIEGQPLSEVLPNLIREHTSHLLPIRALAHSAVGDMLAERCGQQPPAHVLEVIYERTDGNPFFVEQLYHFLSEQGRLFDASGHWYDSVTVDHSELPEAVRLVINHRLERLSSECRRALQLAAVIGSECSFDLLSAVAERKSDALLDTVEQALRKRLFLPLERHGEAILAFRHELIRETIISLLSLPRRQQIHKCIVSAIERVYKGELEEHISDLAHHSFQAGRTTDRTKTVQYLSVAGEQALMRGGFEQAKELFTRAISLLKADEERSRADLLLKRGRAHRCLGAVKETYKDWDEALTTYEHLGEVREVVQTILEIAYLLILLNRHEQLLEYPRRALAVVGKRNSAPRCMLIAVEGLSLGLTGQFDQGKRLLRKAANMAKKLDDPRSLGSTLTLQSALHYSHIEAKQTIELSNNAANELRKVGDLWRLGDALGFTYLTSLFLGRTRTAMRIKEELEPIVERIGKPSAGVFLHVGNALSELMLSGDLDKYEAIAKHGIEHWATTGPYVSFALRYLGFANFWKGNWDEAEAVLRECAQSESQPLFLGQQWGSLILAMAYAGDEDAIDYLTNHQNLLPQLGKPAPIGATGFLLCATEALTVLGKQAEAAGNYPLIRQALVTGTCLLCTPGLFQKYAGISAAAGKQWDKAEQHFRRALQQAHDFPYKLEQPEVRRWYAHMLIDRNGPEDHSTARTLLTEAMTTYSEIGMDKHRVLAEELLDAL